MVLLLSCITEIRDFKQAGSNSFITIDASLSDRVEAHQIFLSYSASSISGITQDIPIKEAIVSVTDNTGIRTVYHELENGVYQTDNNFAGIVGRIYTLDIVLKDGKHYQSLPEKLSAVPPIKDINYEFVPQTNYPEIDGRRVGFNVTLDFEDPAETGQYYQWDWVHYERALYCSSCDNGYDYSIGGCANSSDRLPYYERWNTMRPIRYRCSENCFDITRENKFNIFSDELFNGKPVSNLPILRVPFDNYQDYYLVIEQRAITKDVYEYLNTLKNSTQNNGTLFDTPAITQFSPNIKCISNSKERVLGVFSVFGVDKKLMYINRNIDTKGYRPIRTVYSGREAFLPPGAISPPLTPCVESKTRTKQEPENFHD